MAKASDSNAGFQQVAYE